MGKAKERPILSEVQLQIMRAIWRRREATVVEVWQELSAKRPIARNTVHTLMMRLEKKGHLKHRREGNTFYFSAVRPQRRTLRELLSSITDAAFGGSAPELVRALLDCKSVTKQQARDIREIIDEAVKERGQ